VDSNEHPVPRAAGRERAVRAVRDGLDAAGYTEIGLRVALRRIAGPLVVPGSAAAAGLALRARTDATAVLARLFLLREPVPAVEVAALGALAGSLAAVGLLAAADDRRVATVTLEPDGSDLIVSDALPGSSASALLTERGPLRRVRDAADIGCGAGRIAVRLAAVADRVVAIDRAPRALALCAFNAALNGYTNVEVRLDDAPRPRERFGLIVAHDGDAALGADDRGLVASLPAHLDGGGAAMALVAWAAVADAAVVRPVPWLSMRGVDACILRPAGLLDDAAVLIERRFDDQVGRLRIVALAGRAAAVPSSTRSAAPLAAAAIDVPAGRRDVARVGVE
jgi:SAM-dependent methyltransferase